MPDQPDDNLVPPLKVMRKRLNGVYRADSGFSGPTRRYVLIVALLVGLASVPTLAAITAGSNQLADGKTDTMDIPFLPPASPGPVRTRPRLSPAPSFSPSSPSAGPLPVPPPAPGADAVVRAGRVMGEAGKRRERARRSGRAEISYAGSHAKSSGASRRRGSGRSPDFPSLPGLTARPGFPSVPGFPSFPSLDTPPTRPDEPAPDEPSPREEPAPSQRDEPAPDEPSRSDEPAGPGPAGPEPDRPEEPPAWAGRPFCHERGKCADPSRHHRPDWSRHRQCDNTTHRAHWSHHRAGRIRTVTVHIDPAGRRGHRQTIRQQPPGAVLDELLGSIDSHRSQDDRSEHSRRPAVTERPQNVRSTNTLERGFTNGGYHSRRRDAETRVEDNQIANRSYRGSHRADSEHHADETAAQQRSSRMGRHHADQADDRANRR